MAEFVKEAGIHAIGEAVFHANVAPVKVVYDGLKALADPEKSAADVGVTVMKSSAMALVVLGALTPGIGIGIGLCAAVMASPLYGGVAYTAAKVVGKK